MCAGCQTRRAQAPLLLAGTAAESPPRFNPALVAEMTAQGLSDEDAVAALETCDGDGEKVCIEQFVASHFLHGEPKSMYSE